MLASLQAEQLPRYFPADGKFFSDFRLDQLDLSMHGTENTNSEAQMSMRKRRYTFVNALINDNGHKQRGGQQVFPIFM